MYGLYIFPVQYDRVKFIGWIYHSYFATNAKYICEGVNKLTNVKQVRSRFIEINTGTPV